MQFFALMSITVVVPEFLNCSAETARVHFLDQPDGIQALFAQAMLARTEQSIPALVVPKRGIAIPVIVVCRKRAARDTLFELDAVKIVCDARYIRNLPF